MILRDDSERDASVFMILRGDSVWNVFVGNDSTLSLRQFTFDLPLFDLYECMYITRI